MVKETNLTLFSHLTFIGVCGKVVLFILRFMGFGRVLFQQRSAETVYRHLHHPAKTINGFLCLLIVFLKSKTQKLNLKDVIKLNRNLR